MEVYENQIIYDLLSVKIKFFQKNFLKLIGQAPIFAGITILLIKNSYQ